MISPGAYLLFGKTGVGKSSLINAISHSVVAKTSVKYACTSRIEGFPFSTPSGEYLLLDTPGLCEDDDPETDQQYVSNICDFLDHWIGTISILFVVRSDAKRFRSEDTEVVRGLAKILSKHSLPVLFIASNVDFTTFSEGTRNGLKRLKTQYLIALDSEMLFSTNGRLGTNGFTRFYGVDNIRRVWCEDFTDLETPLTYADTHSLESSLGHTTSYLRTWIHRSGHEPSIILCPNCVQLLGTSNNRRLTKHPQTTKSRHLGGIAKILARLSR